MKNWKLPALSDPVVGTVIVVAAVVLSTEFLFMALLYEILAPMFKLSDMAWGAIDAAVLTAVVAPMSYFALRKMREGKELLHAGELQLQTIIENLTEGLAVSGLDGQLRLFNRAALDLHGFVSLDECRQHLSQFADTFELSATDGTVWPVERWPLARILRGENLRGLEARIRHIRAGWQRVFNYGGTLVRDAGGQPLMAIVTISDITESKRIEKALQDSEARYRRITEALTDYQYTVRIENGRAVETAQSPACMTVTGYAAEEFAANPHLWIQMVVPEDRERVIKQVGQILAGKDVSPIEHRITRKNGETRWVSDTTILFRDASGKLLSYDGVIKDITGFKRSENEIQEMLKAANQSRRVMLGVIEDQQRAEDSLRHLNEELENKVLARTADMEHARREAEQASQAKSAFLAAMSHEIRTPMNGVIGMADMLHQSSLCGYQMEMVDLIRESAYSLLGIINDILDFSKIEADKLEIEHAPTPVAEVVENVCGMLDHMAGNKGVELTLFTDPAIPAEVLGDTLRLRQVLVNLVNNAIKFSGGQRRLGRVSVRAVLAERTAEQVTVEFRVDDNGIGMDAETLSGLFIHFTQADISTTRRFGGTGLGLSIAQHLAELMGGKIEAQSEPGKGATFTVHLPFKLLPAQTDADRDRANSARGSPDSAAAPPFRQESRDSRVGIAPHSQAANEATSHPAKQPKHGNQVVGHEPQAANRGLNPDLQVAGLPCLTVGGTRSLDGDMFAYLLHAGALVERAADMAAAQNWIAARPPGPCVVVIDVGDEPPSPDELRSIARAHPEQQARFVVIRRGQRRKPRAMGADLVSVDGNVLTRRALLKAVAIAAGRIRAEKETPLSGKSEAEFNPPSRDDALRRGQLILVAEDNETNQKVILRQLALLGFAADIADHGRAALERWQGGDYALLLSDLHMPEMDGYELTAAIRAAERGSRHIPIVALTANALKGEVEHCHAVGMDDYLSKPAQLAELKAVLEKWLPVVAADPIPGQATATSADRTSASGATRHEAAAAGIGLRPANPTTYGASPGTAMEAVDVSVLKTLIGDDSEATIRKFLHGFRRSAEKIATELHTACAAGQVAAAGALAHKLKSSARSVGALALGELCAEMEQAGKTGNTEALTELLPKFERELAGVEDYLDGY